MPSSGELVRRAYETWNEDDWEAASRLMHPAVEWHSSGLFPGLPDVCHGREEVHDWWLALKDPWGQFTIHAEELWEEGDRVASAVRFRAVGKESGVEVELRVASAWEFEDGLVRRFRAFGSAEEARAAVGL